MERKKMISSSIDINTKLYVLLVTMSILLSACGNKIDNQKLETNSTIQANEGVAEKSEVMAEKTVNAQPEKKKNLENYSVYRKGKYDEYGNQYSRIEVENGEYEVTLYDKENKIVYQDILPKFPWIYEMTDNILQIGMSGGSLSAYIFYYDKERAVISPYYADSFYLRDNYIAYMKDEKTMVLTDIFEDDELYMEITRDFSDSWHLGGMYLSIKDITWITLNGQDVVVLEYYQGEARELMLEIIPIGDEGAVVIYNDLEEIEKEYGIFEEDICSSVLYDFENVHPTIKARAEYEIQNNEELSQKHGKNLKILLDYHIFDFNCDGLDDYLLCIERESYDGRMEHWIEIYITSQERIYVTRHENEGFVTTQKLGDEIVQSVLELNLPLNGQFEGTGHKRIRLLNEKTEGYYAIVLPESNLILKFDDEYGKYKFCDQ